MNKMIFVSLSLLLAGSASAQVTIILPGGRGNLYIGTGVNLPGPVSNIGINPRINLPAPLLTPTVALMLAPVPVAAAIPVLPVALPIAVPQHAIVAERENVTMPYPALRAQFGAASKDAPAKDIVSSREKLENMFDGRRQPTQKNASGDLGPVRSDRHQSLPEHDLESEIGAY